MKAYPPIPRGPIPLIDNEPHRTWFVYDKLDGSNIRAEWSNKRGFHKFGTRTQLLTDEHKVLSRSKPLILDLTDELSRKFTDHKFVEVTCFFELFGPCSFAGSHDENEEQQVKLLDINVFKQGIMQPDMFYRDFGKFAPDLLHVGPVDRDLFDEVIDGTLAGMTFEGVVAKSVSSKRFSTTPMFKVKTRAWLQKLREKCVDDDALFDRLQ